MNKKTEGEKVQSSSNQELVEDGFLEKLLKSYSEKFLQYRSDIHKNKSLFDNAMETSKEEILEDLKKLVYESDSDKVMAVAELIKDVLGSSVWTSRSYFKYLKSISKVPVLPSSNQYDHDYIIDCVAKNKELFGYTPAKIFQNVFNELCREHADHNYIGPLKFPQINDTIVLVSGVLNELYKTAAFERGVKYICNTYGLNYIVPNVPGRKTSIFNANELYRHLNEYVEKHPDRKLWLLCYSKGGIDTLHFLKKHKEFSEKHISGVSFIASPIQGSTNADHFVIRVLNQLHRLEDHVLYKKIDQGRDIFLKNVPKYLSAQFQSRWLKQSYKKLPKQIFYTSLALETEWYDAHVWMILAKVLFQNKVPNDGVVDVERAHFPDYFKSTNLGIIKGHHLISTRSSSFNQEALIEAHIITLNYLGLLS